jgi:hypothetical protein
VTTARLAEAMGISTTRVRQIEAKALGKLRGAAPLRGLLDEYLEDEGEGDGPSLDPGSTIVDV